MASSTTTPTLPDELLYEISLHSTTVTLSRLMLISQKYYRGFQLPFYIRALFSPDYYLAARFMSHPARQLAVQAPTNPFLYDEVRAHVNARSVLRLIDRILTECCYPAEIRVLIDVFHLDLFGVLAPGVALHHFHSLRRNRTLESLHTVFGIPQTVGLVQVEIADPIGGLLAEFLATGNVRRYSNPVQTYPTLALYSADVLRLSESCFSSSNWVTEFLIDKLAESGTLALLRQPAVLAALVRIGVRFEYQTYLSKVPVSVDELRDIVPYLTRWGSYLGGVQHDLVERRYQLVAPFCELWDFQERFAESFCDPIFLTMCLALQMRDWHTFRRLCRSINLNWVITQKDYLNGRTTILHEAVKANAPRSIIDTLLCCPKVDPNLKDRSQKTPLQYASGKMLKYIQVVQGMLRDIANRSSESPPAKRAKSSY